MSFVHIRTFGILEEFKLNEDAWLSGYNTLFCRMQHDPMDLKSDFVRVAHCLTFKESLVQASAKDPVHICHHR